MNKSKHQKPEDLNTSINTPGNIPSSPAPQALSETRNVNTKKSSTSATSDTVDAIFTSSPCSSRNSNRRKSSTDNSHQQRFRQLVSLQEEIEAEQYMVRK